jgi:hypothetical protein
MLVCAFTLKGAPRRRESVGERKDVRSDQQVRILGSDPMPIDAVSGDGDFRHQIRTGEGYALGRRTAEGRGSYQRASCSRGCTFFVMDGI